MAKRVFFMVLDSFGVGHAADAADFGDEGSDTLRSCFDSGELHIPNLQRLGIFNMMHNDYGGPVEAPEGAFGRANEMSAGKDTTNGHWEMAGVITEQAMPLFPDGFPPEMMEQFTEMTGRGVLLNKPYSGTDAIKEYGEEHLRTGDLIVYTSGDSVFQIAAHKSIVPLDELYRYCEMSREMLTGPWAMGRVIARPFDGEPGNFYRTTERHDYSLLPERPTLLDAMKEQGFDVLAVGKISDIFAGQGVTWMIGTEGNTDGMRVTKELLDRDFHGLCFVNLVDFDMLYGHRNDVAGYTRALNEFDAWLGGFLAEMGPDDVFAMTADHGCDPATPSTDHSRENTPVIFAGASIKPGVDLGLLPTYADIGATIAGLLGVDYTGDGTSRADLIQR